MPNPWDRLLTTESAFSDLQRSLAAQYGGNLYQFTPQGQGGGYTVSTFGPQGPRHLRTDFDPLTQRFYSAGAGFHPSWLGGVEKGPTEAMSGFVGSLISGADEPMPRLQDPFAYQRSQFGGEWWTGGAATPEWVGWQRAQHFMGSDPVDPKHSTPWSYLRRRAEFPESYPTVSGLGRQASGFQYGPQLTHASAFEAIPGMGVAGGGVDTSITSSYGGVKPREKTGLEDPGRLFDIYGEKQLPSMLTGNQAVLDPYGKEIRRTGVQRNVEFAPGFLFPGAGQSYGLASSFRQTEIGQGKTFTTPLSYDQMTTWAMKTGRPVMEIASYMYDRAQRPNEEFANVMGFGMGMDPQARKGTTSYIPQSVTLNLPYGPELGALVQQYAADIIPQWRGSEIGGHGLEILQTYPKTAEEQYSYTSWLNVLDAQGGLRRKFAAGGEVEFFPGEKGAQPFVTTGYEQLSNWTSGHALQMQGVKSVMTMFDDLRAMGAQSQTDILLGGESVKGSVFMAEQLANALGSEQMISLGVPESAFEGGILRGGGQTEVVSAMRSMFTDPNVRPAFEQAVQAAGGSIQTKWMSPPVDPSWIEMMQPGGALASQVVREKSGAAVGSFYLGGGGLEQKLETIMLPSIVAPTESPQRGNLGGFNFNDLIAMSQNNPEVAGAFYNRARETAAPYASLMMAASGLLPPDEAPLQVGEGGIVLPVERARALAAQELSGSPLASMYGPGGSEQPPLKFMLQAMAAEGSPFRGKFMQIESGLGQDAYLPPAEDLLKTQTFTAFGGAVSAVGFKMETMLNRIGTGTEGATPEIAAYMGALTELSRQQGVVSSAFMGKTDPSMTGRLQYVGGVETGGKPGVVLPDAEYGRIMESLGAEGTNEQAMAAFLRWPDAGEHAIFGELMPASEAAKRQRAAGNPAIDARTFRGVGFTGRSAELVQETYADVDKDVGTVVAELASRVPGLEVAGELREKFMTTMENMYPEAIPAATEALAGVMGVTPNQVRPDMLSAGAILSYAQSGKAGEVTDPAMNLGRLSDWAEDKFIAPREISLRELGDVRASEALGKGMIGMQSNFGDMMRFYMSEHAGGLEGREGEVYRSEAHRAQQQMLGIKQSLVDTSQLPNVPEGGSRFEAQSQSAQGLFGPMTADMWRRAGSRAGDITQGVYGQFEERGGRIFPQRAAIYETELLTGFASAAMEQGMDPRGIAALLGGQEAMEAGAPGMLGYLMKTASGDLETKARAVFPFEAGQSAEFRDWFRETPLGAMIYGQGAYRAGRRVLDIEDRMRQNEVIPDWEMKFLEQARPDLESGYWDKEVGTFLQSRATLGVGGRARLIEDPMAEYGSRSQITDKQLLEGVYAQVTSGAGVTSDILKQTPLGNIGQAGVPYSEQLKAIPRPTVNEVAGGGRLPPAPPPPPPPEGPPDDPPDDEFSSIFRGQKRGEPMGDWWWEQRERAVPFAVGGEVLERQIPQSLLEQGRAAVEERKGTAALGGELLFPGGVDEALAGLLRPGPQAGAVNTGSVGGGMSGRPSIAQIAQDQQGNAAAYQMNNPRNAVSSGREGQYIAWSQASNVLTAAFAGIPMDPQMDRAWQGANAVGFLTTPQLGEISSLAGDAEQQVTRARYEQYERRLTQLGTKYQQPGAAVNRDLAMDFLSNLKSRGFTESGGGPSPQLPPGELDFLQGSKGLAIRSAARGIERVSGEDLGAFSVSLKEVTENLGKFNKQTVESNEIMGGLAKTIVAINKVQDLAGVPVSAQGGDYQIQMAMAQAGMGGQMGAMGGAGMPGGLGGGEPPDEFGEGLGGQFRRAGAALGGRLGGEKRIMTFFDLMYLQRLNTALVQPMQQEAMRAEGMDMQTTALMNQMGVGGPIQGMGPLGALGGRMADAQLARGRAFGQAWGGRSLMPGLVEATAPLQAIGGPAMQTFLQASFVNSQMLGNAFPKVPGILGLATAGLGALGYAESMYQQPEVAGMSAQRAFDPGASAWDKVRGIAEGTMGMVAAGVHGENLSEWVTGSRESAERIRAAGGGGGMWSADALGQLSPVERGLAMSQLSQRMGDRLGMGEEQAFGMVSGGLFQAFGGQAINENIMASMMQYGAGGMDPMAGQALMQAQTGELYDPRGGQNITPYTLFAGANPIQAQRFQQYVPGINQASRTFGTGQEITPWEFQGTMGEWGAAEAYWSGQVQGDAASMVASGAISREEYQAMVTQDMQVSGIVGDTMTGARRYGPQQARQVSRRAQAVNQLMAGPGGQQDINVMQTYMEFEGMLGNVGGQQMAVTQQGLTFQQQFAQGNAISRSAAYGPTDFRSTWDFETHAPIFQRGAGGLGLSGGDVLGMAGVGAEGVVGQGYMAGGLVGAQRALRTRGFEMQRARLGISQAQLASQLPYQEAMWGIQDQMTSLSRGFQDFQYGLGGRRMDTQESQFAQNQQFAQMQAGVQADWGRQDIGVAVGRTNVQRQWRREDWAVQDSLRATQWGWQQQDFQENIRFATGRQRRLGIRQQQRGTVMHQAEEEQIERDRERQEQREAWQDEDFEKQRSRHEVRVEWQNERFEIAQKHFDENMELNREAHEEARKFQLEMRELEDEMRDLQRDHWKEQHEFAKQGLALQAEQINNQEDMFKLNNQIEDILEAQKNAAAEYRAGVIDAREAQEQLNDKIREMQDLVDDIDIPGPDIVWPWRFGGPVFPLAHGGPTNPDSAYVVGDGGVPELFIPDSAGRVTPFPQGSSLIQEFFSQVGSIGDTSGAMQTILAIKDLVEALDRTNPDRVREVDTLIKLVAT